MKEGDGIELISTGTVRKLVINKTVSEDDAGVYTAKVGAKKCECILSVSLFGTNNGNNANTNNNNSVKIISGTNNLAIAKYTPKSTEFQGEDAEICIREEVAESPPCENDCENGAQKCINSAPPTDENETTDGFVKNDEDYDIKINNTHFRNSDKTCTIFKNKLTFFITNYFLKRFIERKFEEQKF